MNKIILAAIIIFCHVSVTAQMPSGGPGKNFPAMQNIGHAFGKLVDSAGKGVPGASVLVLQNKFDSTLKKMKEVLLKGSVTENNGEFSFDELPLMGVIIKISASGFKEKQIPVMFFDPSQMKKPSQSAPGTMPAPSFDKDLGKIELTQSATQLQSVVITAGTPTIKMDIDKKVFNVDKNIVSTGGTAVDVMRNVPSVQVDIDGNVTLRNATPQIYIDGRPTTLTLDQIPADAIQSVEVITNPSAKYDASGGNAGILNIVLKKNRKTGYNGNIMAGVDKRGAVNGGGNFNLRQDKVNFSASAFGNQMKNHNTGSTDIRNLLTSPNLLVSQDNKTKMNNEFIFGRVGVDYFATNRTTLSLSGMRVHGQFNPNDMLKTDSMYDAGPYVSYSERNAFNKREFTAYGLQGGF